MRRFLILLALLLVCTGCGTPHLALNAHAKVSADLLPVTDSGPVYASSFDGCPVPCDRTKIAVLDVDGLLLNSDFIGLGSLGDNPVGVFRERLDAIAADPGVGAVVLRINSPG